MTDSDRSDDSSDFYTSITWANMRKPSTKSLHMIGTAGFFFLCVVLAYVWQKYWLILVGMVVACGFARCSQFFIEKNRPATFSHPFLPLFSDFRMFFEILLGRRKLNDDD